MRALALESAQVPIVVVEGAKGTGKTLTARFLLSKRHWSNVARSMGVPAPKFEALMLAGLGSVQTSEKFLAEIDAARAFVSQELEGSEPQRVADIRAYLRKRLTEKLTARGWTDLWLDT